MKRFFLLVVAVGLLSCADNKPNNETKTDSVVADSAPAESDLQALTESWTQQLNLKNAALTRSFYFDTVNYYGDRVSAEEIFRKQQNYFSRYPDYSQRIKEFVQEEHLPDGSYQIRFIKEVMAGGQLASYPSRIIFQQQNGVWKIALESDDMTDITKARNGEAQTGNYNDVFTLTGLVEENTGFAAPEPGQDAKSDQRETYLVLLLDQPLDVIGDPGATNEKTTERGLMRLQLQGDENALRRHLNNKVKLTGKLFHATTSHHHTNVLLQVESIQPNK